MFHIKSSRLWRMRPMSALGRGGRGVDAGGIFGCGRGDPCGDRRAFASRQPRVAGRQLSFIQANPYMTPPCWMPSPRATVVRRVSPPWIKAAVLLALVVAFAYFGAGPAEAQQGDNDYVDVAVMLEYPLMSGSFRNVDIIVMNHGARTAYDVEVLVHIVYPEDTSHFSSVLLAPVGSASLENDGHTYRWSIAALGGLEREVIEGKRIIASNSDPGNGPIFDNSKDPHELFGEVTTSSFESDLHKENNTDRIWFHSTGSNDTSQVKGAYRITGVSVDEPNPSPGDLVNFSIGAGMGANIDIEIAVELTDGLSVDVDSTATPPREMSYAYFQSSAPAPSYSNSVITIGTRNQDERIHTLTSATIPVRVSSTAVVNQQCLTATISGTPAPGAGPFDDDVSNNVARLCLGPPALPYFASADLQEFVSHPCVGDSIHPCDSPDDVRVRAIYTAFDSQVALGPEPPVVHIPDNSETTKYDDDAKSVNSGDIASWQAPVAISLDEFSSEHERWSNVSISISYEMLNKNDDFDKAHFRGVVDAFLNNGQRSATLLSAFNPGATNNGPFELIGEFEKLGTYKVSQTVTATHDNNTVGNTNDDVEYSATGSYTFHVGPMADLAVQDGGENSHVAADQHALTIVAVNNGPDSAGSAKVAGLPTDAEVFHISHGAYDSTKGEWNIGNLKVKGYYRSAGDTDPTLILGASDGATASVSITNSENYEVCVGPADNPGNLDHDNQTACEAVTNASWNSTPVYDYDADNDTATITAQAGTGGVGEGIPAPQTPAVHASAVGIEWDEIAHLYGVPVKDYQVQSSTDGVSGWTQLESDLPLPELVDLTIQSGQTRYYRVRAVNEAGVEGPWSAPMAAIAEAGGTATAGAPDAPVLTAVPHEPNGRTEILITWSKPTENGSAITSYTLQVADRATGPWTDVNPQPGVADERYVYSDGLTGGTRKYFRMLATNDQGDSLWSAVAEAATRAPGISGAPTGVSAAPDGGSAIDVSWSPPLDDGGTPITRYEVQWSADGVSGWSGTGSTADGQTLTFKNSGLPFGATRYYRVAARNSRGLSAWSDPPYASTTTLAGVPGQPSLNAQAKDANTIPLTWNTPADNGDPITHYDLEWSEDGAPDGTWHELATAVPPDTSYDDGVLDPGTRRYYRIRAVNGAGEGSWSRTANATTPAATPGTPSNVSAAPDGENAINVSWDPPTDDGGADITGYDLQVSTDGSDNSYSGLTSTSGSVRTYVHGGLKPGETRHYRVRARNQAGPGEFSSSVSATTLTGVPTAPGLTAQANGATEIKLTWTKPDDRGSDITGYGLQQSDAGNDWTTLTSVAASEAEYVHSGLTGGTTRHYRVRAVNGNGNGQWSSTRTARTDAGGPDAPVLTATAVNDNRINLSWTVPADNGSAIQGYRVERSVDGNAPWEQLTGNHHTTAYGDTTLYRGMTRYYRVSAFNGAGAGPFSAVKSATTTGVPATAPSAPAMVRVSSVSRGRVTLEWAAPEDDGGAPLSGYEYEYSLGTDCPNDPGQYCVTYSDVTTTTGTSATITGLTTTGLYGFSVRAVNPVGRGQAAGAQARLAPSTGDAVRVSPVSFNVDEGDSFTYTVRLATAPPHPVVVFTLVRDGRQQIKASQGARFLVPDNWTHPDPQRDWSNTAFEWDQGATFSYSAQEDADAEDGAALIDIWVERLDYDLYKPCDYADLTKYEGNTTDEQKAQCRQDWNDAWEMSPSYLDLTGPSVAVTVRDDD